MAKFERVQKEVAREASTMRLMAAFLLAIGLFGFAMGNVGSMIACVSIAILFLVGQHFEHSRRLSKARSEDFLSPEEDA